MIAWFVKNPVAANLLMIFIILFGLNSLQHLSLQSYPDIPLNSAYIQFNYSGKSALETENKIALPIEKALQSISGITSLYVSSTPNNVNVHLSLDQRFNTEKIIQSVEQKLAELSSLFDKGQPPKVMTNQFSENVLSVIVSSTLPKDDLNHFAQDLHNQILKLSGVTSTKLAGLIEPELNILLKPEWIKHYGLNKKSVEEKLADIQKQSISIGTGHNTLTSNDIGLLNEVILHSYHDGRFITLKDVADIKIAPPLNVESIRYNGIPAVMIRVLRSDQGNALEIGKAVSEFLAQPKFTNSQFQINIINDKTRHLENRLKALLDNALYGSIIMFILLTCFLHFKIAIWVFIGIFFSFIGALGFMNLFNISINAFSLFGFIVALGLVVDDAIVTGESIYYHSRPSLGLDPETAAIVGTKKVAGPVTFSMLTTIVAMLPLMFIESSFQHYFYQIPIIVIPILFFSFIESKFILPSHLLNISDAQVLIKNDKKSIISIQKTFSHAIDNFLKQKYCLFMQWTLAYRYPVILIMLTLMLFFIVLFKTGYINFSYFKEITDHNISAYVSTEYLSPSTEQALQDAVKQLEHSAQQLKEKYFLEHHFDIIEHVITSHHRQSANVTLTIAAAEQYQHLIEIQQVRLDWYENLKTIPQEVKLDIYDVQSGGFNSKDIKKSDFETLSINIMSDNRLDIDIVKNEIINDLKRIPKLILHEESNENDFYNDFVLTPFANVLGFSKNDIHQKIQDFLNPHKKIDVNFGDKIVKANIIWLDEHIPDTLDLVRLEIADTQNRLFSTQTLVEWQSQKKPTTLTRSNYQAYDQIEYQFDINKISSYEVYQFLEDYQKRLHSRYPNVYFDIEGNERDLKRAINSTILLTTFVFFAIYVLLAIPLKSYTQPLAILVALPFCYLGALAGHFILNIPFGIMSLLGVIAALGVAVNDCLIFVYEMNNIRRKKLLNPSGTESSLPDYKTLENIFIKTGQARFKVVFLTSISTFLSLVPLVFTQSAQGKLLVPMAVSLSFGILFSAMITLILLPIIFMISNDLAKLKVFAILRKS